MGFSQTKIRFKISIGARVTLAPWIAVHNMYLTGNQLKPTKSQNGSRHGKKSRLEMLLELEQNKVTKKQQTRKHEQSLRVTYPLFETGRFEQFSLIVN